jgi:hypothetical protein
MNTSPNSGRFSMWSDTIVLFLFIGVTLGGIVSIFFNSSNGLAYTQLALTLGGLAISWVQVKKPSSLKRSPLIPKVPVMPKELTFLLLRIISVILLFMIILLQLIILQSVRIAKPTPTPLSIVDTINYTAVSPACKDGKPNNLTWSTYYLNYLCLPLEHVTKLKQIDYNKIPDLRFVADANYRLASNYIAKVTLTHIDPSVCAGLMLKVKHSALSYGSFICGDGDWYIVKYSANEGTPTIIQCSTSKLVQCNPSNNKEQPSDHYDMQIGVDRSRFQLFVGSIAHEIQDSEFASTTAICIAFGQKEFLTGLASAPFLASITVSNFSYQQM